MKLRTSLIIASGLVLGGIGLAPLVAQVLPQPGPPVPIACAYNAAPVTLTDGQAGWIQCTNAGKMQVDASVTATASITGFPGASPTTGTPISVTTGGVTGTLPSGAVVVASNVGTTNLAYCKLGATATTSDQPLAPNGGWFAFTVGGATQLTCITGTSTTTVNMVGGSGLPTGTGGGGGGSSGGGTSSAFSAAFPANGTAIGLADSTNMQKWLTALALGDGVNGNNTGAVAGWLFNGTTWDRARGDATNGAFVNVKSSVLPTGASTAAKQPALGTAGTASIDVLTVQGIASMTPFLTNPGTAANWGVLAQGSTTSGELGHLALGAVTTSAPSYTNAQSSALSLDTAGNLRVNVVAGGAGGGAVTVADGADVTQGAKADAAAGTGTVSIVSILKQLHLDVTGAIPAGSAIIGNVRIDQTTPGTTNGVQVNAALPAGTNVVGYTSNDPCAYSQKINIPISITGTTTVKLLALQTSQKIYVCSLSLIATAATIVNVFDGLISTTECNTAQEALIGAGAAAGSGGLSLAANGGLTLGSGSGTIALTNTAAHDLCISQSGSGGLAGNLTYVQKVP
jgi:hypothetical protein